MFTLSNAPVVSYYGSLLSSSEAGDSIQPENLQLYNPSTSTPDLGVAPRLASQKSVLLTIGGYPRSLEQL